jgi:hypothetical protein
MMTARAVPISKPAPTIVMCLIFASDRVNVSGMMPEMNEPMSMVMLRKTTIKKPSIVAALVDDRSIKFEIVFEKSTSDLNSMKEEREKYVFMWI